MSIDGFLTGEKSNEFFETSTFTELIAVKKQDYFCLLEKHQSLKIATNYLLDGYLVRRRQYDYSMRFLSADERYSWFVKQYPYIANRIQLRHLADFLGHTAQSLSRSRSKYQRRGSQ